MPKFLNVLDMSSNKITNIADPTSAQDAATKAYADALANGLVPHPSVVVIVDSNVALSGAQTLDSVAVTAGQRVLLVGQTSASQNGFWVVQSGAWTRPADYASGSIAAQGSYALAIAGTVYKDHGFILTNTTAVTVDTTAQTWQEFTGAGDISVSSPLVKTGNALSLGTVPVGTGGTGATTAAGAKTNLGFMTRFAADIGNGSLTTIGVNHALATLDVAVHVYNKSTGAEVVPDVILVDTNNLNLVFATAPTTNQYRVVVIG